MVDWGPIATTPYPGEPGGFPADIDGDPTGGLDTEGVILPESAVQLVEPDGTHVAWAVDAKTWTWRRGKGDPGAGPVTLARTDPLRTEAVFPRQWRFFDRGVLRARSLIEPIDPTTIDQSEESGEVTVAGGPGAFALTARARVDPLALDLKPKQNAVQFTPFHPDYDDSDWDPCVDVGEFFRPTDWPGGGTNIAGPSGTHTSAPEGSCYIRDDGGFTLASEQTVEFAFNADNSALGFLDGGPLFSLTGLDQQNFLKTHYVRLRLSAGLHRLAAYLFNQPAESGDNPTSLRIVVWSLDGNGERASILYSTTDDWVAYEYPLDRPPELLYPGWTAGQILNWLLDRWEARTGLTIGRSFTGLLDSDGNPWSIIHDFTAPVGQLIDALRAFSEVHADLDWGPEDDELHAWVKDTRGTDLSGSVSLPAGYTDTDVGCLLDLTHHVEPPLLTSALVEWRDAFVLVSNEEADVVVERKIDAPMVATAEAAEDIASAAVAIFGVERVQGSGRLRPGDGQRPGDDFDIFDTINAPNRELELVPQVVQSYTHTADRDGNIAWQVEYGDQMFDREERFNNALKRLGDGSLGGRTFQSTPYRHEAPSVAPLRERTPIIFDHDAGAATGLSRFFTFDDYRTIQAITVTIPGGEGGDYEVHVNGSPVWTSPTIGSDVSTVERELGIKVVPGDLLAVYSDEAVDHVVAVHTI